MLLKEKIELIIAIVVAISVVLLIRKDLGGR